MIRPSLSGARAHLKKWMALRIAEHSQSRFLAFFLNNPAFSQPLSSALRGLGGKISRLYLRKPAKSADSKK
jgi:hypothetical protein